METKRPLQIFLCMALFIVSSNCYAVVMDNLYKVVIQVTDNTIQARNRELPAAFAQVIKKVASSQEILSSPQYETAREHLDRFVSNYFFTDNGNGSYTLTLRFNEQMINNLLHKIGYANLGKDRQQILLWLVMEQENKPLLISQGPNTPQAQIIHQLSDEYGLPVLLPLLDLTERLFVHEADVINENLVTLKQAAQRYNTDVILLGKMQQHSGTWLGEWRLIDGEYNQNWNTSGANLNEQLELMFNKLAQQMLAAKSQLKSTASANNAIMLRIKGVQSIADYASIHEHLKQIEIFNKVEVGSVDSLQATFIISADGGAEAIQKALQTSTLINVSAQRLSNNIIEAKYRIN